MSKTNTGTWFKTLILWTAGLILLAISGAGNALIYLLYVVFLFVVMAMLPNTKRAGRKRPEGRPKKQRFSGGATFDITSERLDRPASAPYKCRVRLGEDNRAAKPETVTVDLAHRWACTCSDFAQRSADPCRDRYFCEHIVHAGRITGIHHPMRWRQEGNPSWLIGELVELDDGSLRMSVDGFVTSRELREAHNLTLSLIERFLPEADATALFHNEAFDEAGRCDLFERSRVLAVLKSEEFRLEWEKTERRREGYRKGAAQRNATLARKRALAEKEEAEARAAFGGCVFLIRCTYTYGWVDLGVWAKDAASAQSLAGRWLGSAECRETQNYLYDDAVSMFEDAMEDIRDEKRNGGPLPGETLHKPIKPKKVDFNLTIESVRQTDLDTENRDMEEIEVEEEGQGWAHEVLRSG